MARRGIGVDIICLRRDREKRRDRLANANVYRAIKGGNKESLLQYLWLSTKFMIVVFFLIQKLDWKRRYKLLHIHNLPDHLVFVGVLQKLLGKPIILDLHDLTVELFGSKWNGNQARVLGPTVKLVEKLSCGFANQLITTSSGFRQRLIERGIREEKINLILNSADERIFSNHRHRLQRRIESGARLLYHGTVAKRFGLELAIEAVARLQDRIPDTILYVYGKYDPSYRADLEEQVERLGLSNLVFFGEYLALEEVSEIIRNSDIGIVPYHRDPFMNLALSTKTFEYVVMQLPVVASRLSSLKSIFDESSVMYFEPGSVGDLSNKIAKICLCPNLRKRQVNRATCAYQRVSWPIMQDRYLRLIEGQINGANQDEN